MLLVTGQEQTLQRSEIKDHSRVVFTAVARRTYNMSHIFVFF